MKKIVFALLLALSTNAYAQLEAVATYDGGDLYFIPAKLTSKGTAFMYSCKEDWSAHKTWFTVFDDEVKIVKQAEIDAQILNYATRTITSKRKYFIKDEYKNEGYFLDEWTVTSDVIENKSEKNMWIQSPEVYEDDNNYHSRAMYLSQTLFNDDDKSNGITNIHMSFAGEECDNYTSDYDDTLGGVVVTLIRTKVYGGVKNTGIEIVSLDGEIKKILPGITSLGTVVAINGNYYVSAYDYQLSKYGLYKIATATTSLSKVADTSAETTDNATYNMDGVRVKDDTKGIVIRNGKKILNK
ncbi:MAG: hypothetical protein IKZ18_04530 [Bacteroidaceae bacterium]|nr:hypothetical protein [Bacteroidaceae bacterium]